jgi:hypothetical protein
MQAGAHIHAAHTMRFEQPAASYAARVASIFAALAESVTPPQGSLGETPPWKHLQSESRAHAPAAAAAVASTSRSYASHVELDPVLEHAPLHETTAASKTARTSHLTMAVDAITFGPFPFRLGPC